MRSMRLPQADCVAVRYLYFSSELMPCRFLVGFLFRLS